MSSQDNNKKLISIHQRRLNILKQKEATFGLNTPPEILIEIEEVEAEIERLRGPAAEEGQLPPLQAPPFPVSGIKKLSSEQLQQLHGLLMNAYPSRDDFTLFVGLRLNDNADDFAPTAGLDVRIFNLMKRYELQMDKLIKAVLADPKHKDNLFLHNHLQKLLEQVT